MIDPDTLNALLARLGAAIRSPQITEGTETQIAFARDAQKQQVRHAVDCYRGILLNSDGDDLADEIDVIACAEKWLPKLTAYRSAKTWIDGRRAGLALGRLRVRLDQAGKWPKRTT